MNHELEARLRDTLGHASEHAPPAPGDLSGLVMSRSRRRRARTHALIAGLAVVAVAVPAALTTVGGQGEVSTGTVVNERRDIFAKVMEGKTLLGDRLPVDDPSTGRPTLLWLARATDTKGDTGTVFCEAVSERGGQWASCGSVIDDEAQATFQGSTEGWPASGDVLYFGASRDQVAAVSAVAEDGARIPGKVQRPGDAPRKIWTVSAPSKTEVTAFEFTDAGGKVLARVKKEDDSPVPEATAEPVAPTMKMPGGLVAGIYETPDRTLIWKRDGKAIGVQLVRAKDLMKDLGGKSRPVELVADQGNWFGIADSRTARVALVFPDGRSATAETRPDPWHIGVTLFSGTHERAGEIYLDGFQVVGYDRVGVEIWREDHPAEEPAWSGTR
ncbi:hypothetical protein ABZ297_12640 [Nonomuraea sp. NPDC005983]|uniref:hypothetical protein n=1 Tax=Nonomuraea sp. NPDC005983 TaxID=3155595 RepID=UPI0033A1E094